MGILQNIFRLDGLCNNLANQQFYSLLAVLVIWYFSAMFCETRIFSGLSFIAGTLFGSAERVIRLSFLAASLTIRFVTF